MRDPRRPQAPGTALRRLHPPGIATARWGALHQNCGSWCGWADSQQQAGPVRTNRPTALRVWPAARLCAGGSTLRLLASRVQRRSGPGVIRATAAPEVRARVVCGCLSGARARPRTRRASGGEVLI